ncbi:MULTISPECIES: DUF1508 domain-containing protein [Cryobacterium]|uniref:DUF1508 domain-containing protein n=1 Tax=Cryobacterium breve TaxID=1259258 RepID=A0ABY2IYC7_9MICO|nr:MULTISPECIES: DUF1508 domain-containing protein [Cryobacterium]TFC97007.1 DUF1508 domain-containing protein [Cryobacterium sp. TmT3-12]TFC97197.1 DUF1508 domain-containing protein [Cryobacterium breve]
MAGKFEVYRDASGSFRFHFAADSGQTIPSPERYRTEDEARERIESLRANISPRRPTS